MKKALIFLICGLLLSSVSYAAVCPEVESIEEFVWGPDFKPLRVALDSRGSAYVTDMYNHNVKVFGYTGAFLRKMDIRSPLGVAVDASGRVYIGRGEPRRTTYYGEVTVYNSSLAPLYKLGRGWGEFEYPVAIATDAERVYVADNRADRVKVYDIATGQALFSFGGYGTTDGSLVRPTGVFVHPTTGNLYITDRALYVDDDGNKSYGAGVHIFTRDGVFIKKFGKYGYEKEVGTMSLPASIVIDRANRVIVSDYTNGYLHVFDDDGNPVCLVELGTYTPYPQGLATGADGRLLIATVDSVYVRGLDDYVRLAVDPASLYYDAQQCDGLRPEKSLTISNEGPGVLSWALSPDSTWITPSTTSGEINGRASVSITVEVNPEEFDVGKHKSGMTVSSQGVKEYVGITLEVISSLPELSVSPSSLSFSAVDPDIPPAETLSIKLSGDRSGALLWSAVSNSTWLDVSPSAGPSNTLSLASVSVDTAGLAGGEYTGNITVTADCSADGPVTVPVTLSYIKGGTINVTTNIAEAIYTITGPETYTGSGTSYTVQGVPEGTYTITFGHVAGFKEPSSYSISVLDGGTADFTGEYKDLRENNNIIATIGGGQWFVPDEIKVFGGDGVEKAAFVLNSSVASDRGKSKYRSRDNRGFSRYGRVTASGDVDGDGRNDIVTASDDGIISGMKADGTPISGLKFTDFPFRRGVDIAVADFDGDGVAEIVVVPSREGSQAALRVFGYTGGTVSDMGINLLVSKEKSYRDRVHVATGDIDGDGVSEILTAQGGSGRSVNVRVWKVDIAGGPGAWSVDDIGGFTAGVSFSGVDISAGDLNADAVDEIIVATMSQPSVKNANVTVFGTDGTAALEFSVSSEKGVNIAAGDTDFDGIAEIVVCESAHPDSSSSVKIYNADGTFRSEFDAFDNLNTYGVRVSLGQLGY